MGARSTSHSGRTGLVLAAVAALILCLSFAVVGSAAAQSGQGQATAEKSQKKQLHKKKRRCLVKAKRYKWGKGKKSRCFRKAKARKNSAPLTGIYDSCQVSSPQARRPLPDCFDRLAVLNQGGFQVVLNYANGGSSIEDNLKYAEQASALGMKVIWNLASYHDMNTGETKPIGPKLDLVQATMNLPATWGYYIGDEHPEDRPLVAQVSSEVRQLTNLPLLYVSRPNPSKLRPFRDLADYIGPDIYPVGPIDRASVCSTARWTSRMTRNPTVVLQAYSWSIDYPELNPQWPSAGQMRQMRNQAMRCGDPKLLLWFCFHCVTDYNPNPDAYWRELAWAANGVNFGSDFRVASTARG
jgi:hypothetical protein